MTQHLDEGGIGKPLKIKRFNFLCALCDYLIDAAVAAVPGVFGINVSGPFVIPVRDKERTVRSCQAIDGAKPRIVCDEKIAAEVSLEARALGFQDMPVERVREQIAGDILIAIFGRKT